MRVVAWGSVERAKQQANPKWGQFGTDSKVMMHIKMMSVWVVSGYTSKWCTWAYLPTSKWCTDRQTTHQIDVLYKEILKAISKRELLEDLVKDSLCWRVSPGKWPDSPLGGYSVSRSRRSVAYLSVIVPGLRPRETRHKSCAPCAQDLSA